jgi:N terminal of Calcineurin-like phosphoesterase
MAATAANTVSGVVYENRSGGTRRAAGDPGIAGVLVSNGRDVVKTDAAGRYTLPIDEESIIFVIKPTGYAVPVDEQMLPRFYYIHQPAGSPQSLKLRYRGIEPTGALPDSVVVRQSGRNLLRRPNSMCSSSPIPNAGVQRGMSGSAVDSLGPRLRGDER